ncbi:PIG-L deacetylase family protein [Serinicoccus sp. CUA-874]|uniref:PIG-L deacetylase family protein n=1 Tax=Serinicoccus sp. CUA-874 TaxID=1517939 RepID=UPI00096A73B5|nr:PIG-L family deacetylase [Serinicoccus sp. CUA-874]
MRESHQEDPDVAPHILCVTAHPDDAEIALGGAISAWCHAGLRLTVAVCSTSERSAAMSERRKNAAARAARILGHELTWVFPHDLRRVEDVTEHELVGRIDGLVRESGADAVLAHADCDSHADHRMVSRAVLASSRTWPDSALLSFGVSEPRTAAYTRFQPSIFIPVAGHLESKRAAIHEFHYDGKGYRDLDDDAMELRLRAMGSLCGVDAAEGLSLLRVVGQTRGARALAWLLRKVPDPSSDTANGVDSVRALDHRE